MSLRVIWASVASDNGHKKLDEQEGGGGCIIYYIMLFFLYRLTFPP